MCAWTRRSWRPPRRRIDGTRVLGSSGTDVVAGNAEDEEVLGVMMGDRRRPRPNRAPSLRRANPLRLSKLLKSNKTPVFRMPSITVRRYRPVAAWQGETGDEVPERVCGICHSAIDGCCGQCKIPGDECPMGRGKCGHSFHAHCIIRWVASEEGAESSSSCPMCRQPWMPE